VAVPAVSYRTARAADADGIGALHADSWRRFYRGAFADEYLDGDVLAERRAVWTARLASPAPDRVTIVAEVDAGLAGFIHLVLDEDERWGSLVDNLHVAHDRQRLGIGAALMVRGARAAVERGRTRAMYLWVLEQNTRAQAFYAALGGRPAGQHVVEPPGGVPGRLNGSPLSLRYVWPDASGIARPSA
jgi:ribosomal protein S18 acetylase RimI-like enzyme